MYGAYWNIVVEHGHQWKRLKVGNHGNVDVKKIIESQLDKNEKLHWYTKTSTEKTILLNIIKKKKYCSKYWGIIFLWQLYLKDE